MNEIGQDKNHYIITVVVLLNYNPVYMICVSIFNTCVSGSQKAHV